VWYLNSLFYQIGQLVRMKAEQSHSHEVGKITRCGTDELLPFVVVVAGRTVEDDEVGKSASTSTSPSTSI
jgi:hypothetical protein